MSRASVATASAAASPRPPAPAPTDNASTAAPLDQSADDRRAHQRLAGAEVPFISKVRLKYGPSVTLIDLSTGGAQIETTNFRLQPGSSVVLEIVADERELSIPAQVLRCQLATLLPEPVYRGALVFKQTLDLSEIAPEGQPAPASPVLGPQEEHARLRQVLTRLALGDGKPNPTPESVLTPLFDAANAALATLESPAGRRVGAPLGADLAALFRAVADATEKGATPAGLQSTIEEHLRHVVPANAIHIAEAEGFARAPGAEAILLSVPRLNATTPTVRVAVEFPDGCEPQELHFQILKAGLQLMALARELGRLNGSNAPLAVRPGGPEAAAGADETTGKPLPKGWSRVVIRYTNGELRKGFTHNFMATKGYIHLMPEPVVAPDNRLAVPFTELKAIFFVKDLAGNPGYVEVKGFDPSARGRKVTVTFKDGEELAGTTANYNSSAPGFFVQPADPQCNNDRVFVVAQAVRGLAFV